jgi:hypothetical protein
MERRAVGVYRQGGSSGINRQRVLQIALNSKRIKNLAVHAGEKHYKR